MNVYTYNLTSSELKSLCEEQGWFTCGTNEQYEKLFRVNDANATVQSLATLIWMCSDGFSLTEIQNALEARMALPINMIALRETLMEADWGVQEVEIIMEAVSSHPEANISYRVV